MEFRAEIFNLSNTPAFAQPNGVLGSSAFGTMNATATDPRVIQRVWGNTRMNHLYIVVRCKTASCHAVHVLMHLGEKGKIPERVEYWMCYPLMVECPSCKTIHDYSDSEEEFRQKELPAPPHGYFDRLAAPLVHEAHSFAKLGQA